MLNVVCSTANVVKKCNSILFVPECVVKYPPPVVNFVLLSISYREVEHAGGGDCRDYNITVFFHNLHSFFLSIILI